jgi:hypothetical protein
MMNTEELGEGTQVVSKVEWSLSEWANGALLREGVALTRLWSRHSSSQVWVVVAQFSSVPFLLHSV